MYHAQLLASFVARPWGIYPHAFFGALALGVGAFQFHQGLRDSHRALHRAMGRVYVGSCAIAGTAGLYMAWFAYGGAWAKAGFGCMAAALLISTEHAYRAARRADIRTHQMWMLCSYAVLFSAVTLRIELPILASVTAQFATAYRIVAWSCWVPNLMWAILYARFRSGHSVSYGAFPVESVRPS